MEPGTQASISINHPEVMFSTIDLVSTQETPNCSYAGWRGSWGQPGPALSVARIIWKELYTPSAFEVFRKIWQVQEYKSVPARINLLPW